MKEIAAKHPEPDILAAFVDGNVSGEELRNVIAHIGTCEDCRTVIRVGAQFQRQSSDRVVVKPTPVSFRLAAAAALILVAAGTFLLYRRSTDPLRFMQGDYRTTEARVGAFAYAPFAAVKRSAAAQDAGREAAVEKLRRLVEANRNAENLHRLALGELALGRADAARALLLEASRLDDANAEMLSDLAAAQIAMNLTADAAETSARALERAPDLPEARFNWALSLELLSVRPSAVVAWEEYLRVDSTGEWSNEARRRIGRLQRPRPTWEEDKVRLANGVDAATLRAIVTRHPQQAQYWVFDHLLPEWARERRADLNLARSIGLLRAQAGDPYLADVVEHAAGSHDSRLRDGILLYEIASKHMDARDTEAAATNYADAAELLRRSGSPLALSADIIVASTDYYGGRSDKALARLDAIAEDLRIGGNRYPGIAAEQGWVRGLVWSRRDANASLAAYRSGLAEARRAADTELEAGLSALIAEVVDRVGDPAEADRIRGRALRQLGEAVANRDRMYVAFSSNAFAALRAGRPHLALAFVDAQQSLAGQDPLLLAESDAARALAFRDLGRLPAATKLIQSARGRLAAVKTKAMRDRTASNIEFIAGTIEAKGNPGAAVASLTYAIDTWQQYGWHVHNATAYLVRGEVQLASGRRAAAEDDFRAGIAEMEQQRGGLSEPRLREAYFERADRLFDRLIELLIDEGRFDVALTIAERKRGRELLTALAANASAAEAAPMDASTLAATVEPSSAIIEYVLLDRGVAMWVLRGGQTAFVRGDSVRPSIERTIRGHLAAIATTNDAEIARLGRELYDELIAPASPHLRGVRNLVIIGDGALQTVPFAALVGPDDRYLIQNFRLAFAPSASVFARNERTETGGRELLAVAQPGPSGMEFLANAEMEVREVADLYGGNHVLVGSEVGPNDFLMRSGRASTVHFAGHAVLDDHQPSASSLVFESSQNRVPLLLRAATIAATHLPSRPLVVLAGCSTGRGPLRQNEGVDSLSAAFLRAGARGVVATLWDIDDSASSRLLTTFHRHLGSGATAADALRDAQLSLLGSSDPKNRRPEAWAGFVLLGTM